MEQVSPTGRVLIVEDDGVVAELVRQLLVHQGYEVVDVARDGKSALDAVQRLRPDVVVMDLHMPQMGGVEATRQIQEVCPTPVVVLTAHDDLQLTVEAAAAGAGAYLVKPPNDRELLRAITVARARFDETQALSAQNTDWSTFAHTVAHDLKNSLQPIVGMSELLREDLETTSPEAAQAYLGQISGDARKLGHMLDDLLLLAEVRDRDLLLQRVKMVELVAEAQSRLTALSTELGAHVRAPEHWPEVRGYGPWVVEVWVNYLSNALKYGGRPPQIELGWRLEGAAGGYRFWVRDNGAGLSEEEQAQLFTPYVQLHPGELGGHGLGLSIARRIVEKLNGSVGVESTVGEGSTFWFSLPGG
jgi:two-component system, sensor histidine kinase and response regulator